MLVEQEIERSKIDGSNRNEKMLELKESEKRKVRPLGMMKSRGIFVDYLLAYLV